MNEKRDKEPKLHHQGSIWLIVAMIGIGVVYFGLTGLGQQMEVINQSIQKQTHSLSDITSGMQQMILVIKDAVQQTAK